MDVEGLREVILKYRLFFWQWHAVRTIIQMINCEKTKKAGPWVSSNWYKLYNWGKSSFKTLILIWGLEQQSAINCKWSLLPYSNSQLSDCASDMLQIQLRKWNKGTKRSDTFCLSPSVSLHALSWWVFCALILARGSEGKKNECASKCAGNPQPHHGYAANCDAFSSLSLLDYWAHPSRLTGK